MKDDVISNTHANKDKQRMKIKDNVVSNIQEQKKTRRKKTKDDAIFNTQNSKDKQKIRVKDDAIIKQVQIITMSTFKIIIKKIKKKNKKTSLHSFYINFFKKIW